MLKTLQLQRYVMLVGLLIMLSTQAWSTSTRWPTEGCTRQADILRCTGTIPPKVPQGIMEVIMVDITDVQIRHILTEHLFCHTSWSTVETVSILGGQTEPYIHSLYDNMFECLGKLATLTLMLPYLDETLPEHTFVGLGKVTTLDMSNCERLSPTYFFNALKDSKNLPKLSKLVLHKMNSNNDEPIHLTEEMLQTLSSGRNITELDISNTRLSTAIGYHFGQRLCQTLKVINVSEVRFITDLTSTPVNISPCYSLETLDISGCLPSRTSSFPIDTFYMNENAEVNYVNMNPKLLLFKNIKTLYSSNVNPFPDGKYIYLRNSMLNISVLYDLKHLDVSNNKLKYIDGVLVSEYICLESLDLSQNDMEYLTPRFFQQKITTSLRSLDISQNMLWHMEGNQTEFETMFYNLILLDVLHISHNNLTKIPKGLFEQNKNLHHLDISNNKLTHVNFHIEHLINLQYFDISGNSFVNLDSNTIHVLTHIYVIQTNMSYVRLNINLRYNPLQCSKCSDLDFSKWMTTSPIIDNIHEGYVCETETQAKKPIARGVVNDIHTICDRPLILRKTVMMATMIPAVVITMLVITIRYAVKLVRQKRDDAHVEKIRRQIENDDYEFKYPIFLSYSSLDDDIVLNHLYGDLQYQLRVFCRTDREMVCIGDKHFRAGRWIFDEFSRCLEMSAMLVVVVSNNYCHSDWCIDEMQQAYQKHKQMLLIFIENVDEEDMHPILREHFRKRVRVKFCSNANGDYEIHPEWDNVCYSIIWMLP